MKEKCSRTERKKEIEEFFENIKNKSKKDVKKIKKQAMKNRLKLRDLRKKFCKKCFSPYKNSKIRIKNKIKSVICDNCGYISRWKIKD
jgi:RNase P subunit RPR2